MTGQAAPRPQLPHCDEFAPASFACLGVRDCLATATAQSGHCGHLWLPGRKSRPPRCRRGGRVRSLFRRYIEAGSVVRLKTVLDAEHLRSPVRMSRTGRREGAQPLLRPLHLVVRETEFCGLRLAGEFRCGPRENGRNSVRRPRHASLTDRNYEDFCRPGNRVGLLGLDGGGRSPQEPVCGGQSFRIMPTLLQTMFFWGVQNGAFVTLKHQC